MQQQEPMIPDPEVPGQLPGPDKDPPVPDQPDEYDVRADDDLEGYDQAEADSFPASDPPAAAEPGGP